MEAAAIRKIDAGSWFGLPFRSTRIPDLEETLKVLGGRVQLYVDAKQIAPDDLARELSQRSLLGQAVVYQSPGYLRQLKLPAPEVRRPLPAGQVRTGSTALAERSNPMGSMSPGRSCPRS